MNAKTRPKKWTLMLVLGVPTCYWLGTMLLKDMPSVFRMMIYYAIFWALDWLATRLFNL